MKEHSSKIAFLESHTLQSLEKHVVVEDDTRLKIRARIRGFFLRTLLGIENGVLYVFSLRERMLRERLVLEDLKNERIIDSYGEGVVYADYPRINFFGIFFRVGANEKVLRSWGYAMPYEDKSLALRKALWELCERSASFFSKEGETEKGVTERKGDATPLYESIPKCTEAQTKVHDDIVRSVDDLRSITGRRMRPLFGGSSKFIPLQTFFWGDRIADGDVYLHEPTTSGSGAGTSFETATVSALYELIERDHFLLYWFSGVAPREIDVRLVEGQFFDAVRDARERFSLEVYFFDTTYDIDVRACVCLIIDPVLDIAALGGKVSALSEHALTASYLEALATLNLVRSRNARVGEERLTKLVEEKNWGSMSVDKSARVNLYNSPKGIRMLREMFLGREAKQITYPEYSAQSRSWENEGEEYRHLAHEMERLYQKKGEGYETYVHEFTSPLAKRFGYRVVHAFVPAFLKMHLTERFVAPISPRLTEFMKTHNKSDIALSNLRHLPHPFP